MKVNVYNSKRSEESRFMKYDIGDSSVASLSHNDREGKNLRMQGENLRVTVRKLQDNI